MWYMAVSDKLEVIAVSDLGDEKNHKVQIYDFNGRHLRVLASGTTGTVMYEYT